MSAIQQVLLGGTLVLTSNPKPAVSFSNYTGAAKQGEVITTSTTINLFSVTKNSGCDATICYIEQGATYGGTLVSSTTFVGDDAVFNISLPAGTYTISVDKGGINYTQRYATFGSYPVNRTHLNYISAGSANYTQRLCIENIKTY